MDSELQKMENSSGVSDRMELEEDKVRRPEYKSECDFSEIEEIYDGIYPEPGTNEILVRNGDKVEDNIKVGRVRIGDEYMYIVDEILHYFANKSKTEDWFLIKWQGWDESHNSYETTENVTSAEEKVAEYFEKNPSKWILRQKVLANKVKKASKVKAKERKSRGRPRRNQPTRTHEKKPVVINKPTRTRKRTTKTRQMNDTMAVAVKKEDYDYDFEECIRELELVLHNQEKSTVDVDISLEDIENVYYWFCRDDDESYDFDVPGKLNSNLGQVPGSPGHEVGIMDHQMQSPIEIDSGVSSDINDSPQHVDAEGIVVVDISSDDDEPVHVKLQFEKDLTKTVDIIDLTVSDDEVEVCTPQQFTNVACVPRRFCRRTVTFPTIPLVPHNDKWERRFDLRYLDFGDII